MNGINPPLAINGDDAPFRLEHGPDPPLTDLVTEITPDGGSLTTAGILESPELAAQLPRLGASSEPSTEALETLESALMRLHQLNRRVLALAVQELRQYEHQFMSSGSREWSLDGETWRELHQDIHITGVSIHQTYGLDAEWTSHLQHLLTADESPFMATVHLHEARRNGGARFRWIEATVAAELAIKEALIRLEPKLEILIMEVPSPPIRKLYGSILESLTGEKSPFVGKLSKGAEVRNQLVHRPSEPDPDLQDVADYVSVVDQALRHLRKLCYERNPNIGKDQLHTSVQWDRPDSA